MIGAVLGFIYSVGAPIVLILVIVWIIKIRKKKKLQRQEEEKKQQEEERRRQEEEKRRKEERKEEEKRQQEEKERQQIRESFYQSERVKRAAQEFTEIFTSTLEEKKEIALKDIRHEEVSIKLTISFNGYGIALHNYALRDSHVGMLINFVTENMQIPTDERSRDALVWAIVMHSDKILTEKGINHTIKKAGEYSYTFCHSEPNIAYIPPKEW